MIQYNHRYYMASVRTIDLREIEIFEPICRLAEELKVEIVLHGGTASRLAMHLCFADAAPDLFELVPFSSDIDLDHSGPPALTIELAQAIEERVPFASWFRWSISDRTQAALAAEARALSTVLPLRSLRLSTSRINATPTEVLHDLHYHQVSLMRNPAYGASAFAKAQRDVELFGLMLAWIVEGEMRSISGVSPVVNLTISLDENERISRYHSRIEDPYKVWEDLFLLRRRDFSIISDNPKLLTRFWHLFATRVARAGWGQDAVRMLSLMEASGILKQLQIPSRPTDIRCMGVSGSTSAGRFRLGNLAPNIATGPKARAWLQRQLEQRNQDRDGEDLVEEFIDPSFELIAAGDLLLYADSELNEQSIPAAPFFSDGAPDRRADYFVQLCWEDLGYVSAAGLTAQIVSRADLNVGQAIALPAVGGVFNSRDKWGGILQSGRPWIRARADGLGSPNGTDAILVVLQAK